MIARLKGIVESTGPDWAVIDVGGVGYLVYCSGRTLGRLPAVGEAVAVHVETHVREDHIHLYGFHEAEERAWFRLLSTVQGVGSKVALAILSLLGPEQLLHALAAQDKAALTRASGVGPKLATRILSELKDKAGQVALGAGPAGAPAAQAAAGPAPGADALSQAASALVNLGFARMDAHAAVSRAARDLGDGAAVDALIRAGLKDLAPEDRR